MARRTYCEICRYWMEVLGVTGHVNHLVHRKANDVMDVALGWHLDLIDFDTLFFVCPLKYIDAKARVGLLDVDKSGSSP